MMANRLGRLRSILAAIAVTAMSLPGVALADHETGSDNADVPLTDLQTSSAVYNIHAVRRECLQRDAIYQIDCVRQGLELSWRQLPYHGDYGAMRDAIQQASTALERIVEANADRQTSRFDSGLNANSRFQARRHYTPVLKDKLSSAVSDAQKALGNLQSALGHAGQTSDRWNQNYSRVATAIKQIATRLH
jgi:hypothetical protein